MTIYKRPLFTTTLSAVREVYVDESHVVRFSVARTEGTSAEKHRNLPPNFIARRLFPMQS